MAQYGDEFGHVQNQELDNQVVHEQTGGNKAIGTEAMAMNDIIIGEFLHQQQLPQQEKISSITEDEGEGGLMKKKELTEKIMEKIPRVDHKEQQSDHHTTTGAPATTVPGGEAQHGDEKKGMMDKIKEKLDITDQKSRLH